MKTHLGGSIRLGRRLPILVALAMACSFGFGCDDRQRGTDARLRPVRTVTVAEAPLRRTRVFSGVSRPAREVELSFRVAGSIEALPIDTGTEVRAGDLVARLDDDDFRIRVGEAKAVVAQSRARERDAEAKYERVRRLYENDNAALSDLDAARAAYESARAEVRAAQQRLAMARRQLDYTTLRAPFDGVIADVLVEADENVTPGHTVALLQDMRKPEVEIAVPENFIGEIEAGEIGRVTFDALPEAVFEAEVTEVAPSAVRRATFPVRLRLVEPDQQVRPGLAAEVEMKLSPETRSETDGIVVPPVAISEDRDGTFALVVSPSHVEPGIGVVQRREVEVGGLQPEGMLVTSGLHPGERLIVAGMSYLEDGERVRLEEQTEFTDRPEEGGE